MLDVIPSMKNKLPLEICHVQIYTSGEFSLHPPKFSHLYLVFPLNLITVVCVLSNEASRSMCFSTWYFSLLAGNYIGTSLEVKMPIVLRLNMWMFLDPTIPHLGI